jgi:hypothetical protein
MRTLSGERDVGHASHSAAIGIALFADVARLIEVAEQGDGRAQNPLHDAHGRPARHGSPALS